MLQHYPFYIKFFLGVSLIGLSSLPSRAQLIPDGSLGSEHSVSTSNQVINGLPSTRISGGARRSSTLFHSFKEFNVPTDKGVYFNNPSNISNIFTRVTGTNSSNIFGTLGVLGPANLFLLNSQGVIFGPSASLYLKGSFLATTAKSFVFSNGTEFGAESPQAAPLLTVDVPIGLKFTGSLPSQIRVEGTGHTLTQPAPISGVGTGTPFIGGGASTTGLRVQPGKSIALVGGNVSFEGGVVTAPAGQIEVGSVLAGIVQVDTLFPELELNFATAPTLGDIQLDRLSLLDASGLGSGDINLQGREIALKGSSYALVASQGANSAGNINVSAVDTLLLRGNTINPNPDLPLELTRIQTGIVSQVISGQGANINISARDLLLDQAGGIVSFAIPSGTGGNVLINATDSIQLSGLSSLDPLLILSSNLIATSAAGLGMSGDIQVRTRDLLITDGALIGAATIGVGKGGDIAVIADSIEVSGNNPISLAPSIISTVAFVGPGNAGDVDITTKQLRILNGGNVASSTQGSGSAGDLIVNASNFIEVRGTVPGSIPGTEFPSNIISSGNNIDPLVQQLVGLPLFITGNSGNVTTSTKKLTVADGAQVTVKNDGLGKAGALRINAKEISIENNGGLSASTANGDGGNIFLNVKDQVFLRNSSSITASANKLGNGGNITIDPDLVVLLESSRISADAQDGLGGSVDLTAQGYLSP